MKNYIIVAFLFLLCSCSNENTGSDTTSSMTLEGNFFLQPINRPIALTLASIDGEMTLKIIDSNYCNIDYSQTTGNYSLSRIYKIQNWHMIFDDPVTKHKVTYEIASVGDDNNSFILKNESGTPLFKVWSYQIASDKLSSENSLQKNAFRYPTLSPQEQVSGAEQVVEENGKINMIESPDKEAVSKINIYKLF